MELYNPKGIDIDSSLFGVMVDNWIHLESIVDYSKCLDLSTQLFERAICKQLTSIDISFCDDGVASPTIPHNKLKTLIASIHNAPSLEIIAFRLVPIKIADMENLHRRTPNLKSVKLEYVRIWTNEDPTTLVDLGLAKKMTCFSLGALMLERSEGPGERDSKKNVLDAWILYVGDKYTQSQDLELHMSIISSRWRTKIWYQSLSLAHLDL